MRKILNIGTRLAVSAGSLIVGVAAGAAAATAGSGPSAQPVRVVVTTSILGDIVTSVLGDLVGDAVTVEVVMPEGADPHLFQPSARQAEVMENADVLVVNGRGLEVSLRDLIDAGAGGEHVFTFADHLGATEPAVGAGTVPLEAGAVTSTSEDHGTGARDHGPDALDEDPHIWMDPSALVAAVEAFGAQLVSVGVPADRVRAGVSSYVGQLTAVDRKISDTLARIPVERRVLVTNHDNLGLFARRYGLTVLGSVIPSTTTGAEASAAQLESLAAVMRDRGLPAMFAETTSSDRLAEALAEEVGSDVRVVELYTDSLGPAGSGADTYLGMLTVDATLIADALVGVP